ncbi:hypothetical protein DSECCO2_659040 [anaerobic digester metagenome]
MPPRTDRIQFPEKHRCFEVRLGRVISLDIPRDILICSLRQEPGPVCHRQSGYVFFYDKRDDIRLQIVGYPVSFEFVSFSQSDMIIGIESGSEII